MSADSTTCVFQLKTISCQYVDVCVSHLPLDIDTRRLSGSALSLQAGGSQEICNDPTDTRSAADFEVSSMNSENISTTEAVKYCQVIFDYKVSC